MSWRRLEERLALCVMGAACLLVCAGLLWIIGVVVVKGFGALSWSMLVRTPQGGFYMGAEGGIFNAIAGSVMLGLSATLLAFCMSLPLVIAINVFDDRHRLLSRTTRFMLDILWGVPSIVYGAAGFALMVALGMRASLGAAAVTVACLIVPIMARTMDEAMRGVSRELYEVSYALGSTRWETASRVIARQISPAVVTALLIALGRGMGDAASVLFTAGFSDHVPSSLGQPVATLPLAVFFQLATPLPAVQQRGFAAALVLTVLIVVISIVTRLLARRFTRHVVR